MIVELPSNPRVCWVCADGLLMDPQAIDQLLKASQLPGCERAAGMPDLHAGPGWPIGAAVATRDRIYPGLIGSDIGCGALLVTTGLRSIPIDPLERRLTSEFAESLQVDKEQVVHGVLSGPEGLSGCDALSALARSLSSQIAGAWQGARPSRDLVDVAIESDLGGIGGGNHFAEVVVVKQVHDERWAAQWGLGRGMVAVLVHTGSRGLGKAIADRYCHGSLSPAEATQYMEAHDWGCAVARLNRFLVCMRVLGALGVRRSEQVESAVDRPHNVLQRCEIDGGLGWLHRKGAASAGEGEPTILLGSRGSPSYVMVGAGRKDTLGSMAHGSGRRLSRAAALSKYRAKHTKKALLRTALGGRVVCDRVEALFEEHPDAYKPVGAVLSATQESGMAHPVAELHPIVTVKQ